MTVFTLVFKAYSSVLGSPLMCNDCWEGQKAGPLLQEGHREGTSTKCLLRLSTRDTPVAIWPKVNKRSAAWALPGAQGAPLHALAPSRQGVEATGAPLGKKNPHGIHLWGPQGGLHQVGWGPLYMTQWVLKVRDTS